MAALATKLKQILVVDPKAEIPHSDPSIILARENFAALTRLQTKYSQPIILRSDPDVNDPLNNFDPSHFVPDQRPKPFPACISSEEK